MGKRRIIVEEVKQAAAAGARCLVLTNRRILMGQAIQDFQAHGVEHGVLAAGYDFNLDHRIQVGSIQTIRSRIGKQWDTAFFRLFDRIWIDECHRRDFDSFASKAAETGAVIQGYTATPINLPPFYKSLVTGGTVSEGRKVGALVPCHVFAPEEPSMKGVRLVRGEYEYKGMVQRVMQCICFASVFDELTKQNHFWEPTLLFAPGVPESRWFVEQFAKRGVSAAHIDAETNDAERQRILTASRDGEVKVLCSYGVLREGFDAGWLRFGVLVQVCGALSTYLQMVGRMLRAWPGKQYATLLDFSGAWHRHGSPNIDRAWKLGDTDIKLAKARKLSIQKGEEIEPIRCPQCGGIRSRGPKCPHCGYAHTRSVRAVRMLNGTLKKMVGNVVKKKPELSSDQKCWNTCLYAAAARGRTVGNAVGDFYRRSKRQVTQELNPQPPNPGSNDFKRKVIDVWPWLNRRKVACQST